MERRLTQEALARKADIHSTWISHVESGRINPTFGNVVRLSKGLGMELSELVARAEEIERLEATRAAEDEGSPPSP
jgi:transcriptional regulator with XRE-family HTH domain